ncbi:hypothetical protein [Lacisediminihabitans changchengi]|uniref:YtxH domain-containing protein n=1 Tax=Lacisediminihabitans changchengi TaxID=2787634 RepID=A0A934SUX6_9MICO|nr:hypothetical protein [Lacisediminihabitans changchengi]MBK4348494.1 hypothetical protein [Lacisediminihabitans changchengi]
MRPKLIVIALIAFAAYVLGARAGHDRYEEIKHAATKYWNDPEVKKARKKAKKLRDKARKAASKQAHRLYS